MSPKSMNVAFTMIDFVIRKHLVVQLIAHLSSIHMYLIIDI